MAILQRNVSGYDLLAIRKYITEQEPVPEEIVLTDYYPGDSSDPGNSNQLKPIRDALRFLVEVDQIVATDDGYVMNADIPGGLTPRLALLWGIHRQDGDDSAYLLVLEELASQNVTKFDHGDELLDLMDGAQPEFPWTEKALQYWRRVMNIIGVTQPIHSGDDGETTLLSPDPDLLVATAAYCMAGRSESLPEVLRAIDETFLPVFSTQRTISTYVETTLLYLERTRSITLSRPSDRDVSIEVDGTPYNTISLEQ